MRGRRNGDDDHHDHEDHDDHDDDEDDNDDEGEQLSCMWGKPNGWNVRQGQR